jgi:hypothetical protein
MGAFADLCNVAERNGLTVEIAQRSSDNWTAIWIIDDRLPSEFVFDCMQITVRRAVVATPFWEVHHDKAAPQLIQMLADRGFK